MQTRTHFHSSQLIRCLADLAMVDVAGSGNAFAEKLGQWVHFADAIALSAVHSERIPDASPHHAKAHATAHAAAAADVDRLQAMLANSITKSFSQKSDRAHNKLPLADFSLPLDLAAAFVPYRRFYEAHQRDMELSIQPLRVNLREALAKLSPRQRKLAELDATLEKILRDRENKLLSRVPVLLKKRFEQLFREHQQQLDATGQADNPAGWMKAGAWLACFCHDMQTLLLAELDLRLQPALGLLEAFTQDK
jgi:hypothetical protein